jgi:TPR repeat protein
MLGLLYGTGNGVPKDLTQAVQWFQKAAAQGDPRGCAGLGRAYEKGLGGMPQDRDKAIEWYRKAGDNPLAKKGLERLGAN